MSAELARAHIEAQAQLRAITTRAVATVWQGLPGYDERDVTGWLTTVLPVVLAAQRHTVALTEAFLAMSLGRQPLGVSPTGLVGQALRGTPPADVYRRPFVAVWTALGAGNDFEAAVASGLTRATSAAATDVQLAHRATLQAVQDRDPRIRGYRRVADDAACGLCLRINGAFVKSASAMPLHPHCGCSLEPVQEDVAASPVPDGVAVHEHGELGPTLAEPGQHFTSESDI